VKVIINYINDILFIIGDSKGKIIPMVFFFLLVSFLDLVGIGFIGAFVSLISNSQTGDIHQQIFEIFNISISKEKLPIYLGLLIFVVFLLKTVAIIISNKKIIDFTQEQMVLIVSQMMKSYQKVPYIEFLNRSTSEIIHNIQQVPGMFTGTILNSLLRGISDGIVAIGIVVYLAWTDFYILLILASSLYIVVWIYDVLYRDKINQYGSIANKAVSNGNRGVIEGVGGLKEIRILGKESFFYKIVHDSAKEHAKARGRYMLLQVVPRYLIEMTVIGVIVLIIVFYLYKGQDVVLLAPILAVFGVAAIRLIPVVNSLVSSVMNLIYGQDTVNRLRREIIKSNNIKVNTDNSLKQDIEKASFSSLELVNVSFKYPNSKNNTIEGINLKIEAGSLTGIIGETGSGKSTLVDLILGLIHPKSGDIYYNNIKVGADNGLKSKVAYIPQDIFIIDDTLSNNVTLEFDERKVSDDMLSNALTKSQLIDTIRTIPNGINEKLGDKGVALSGGQRQRVALARALYHDREILVMDEVTSALDAETESEVIKEIDMLKGKKTIIIIAHKLNTLEGCDRIIKLKDGKIILSGSYKEVILNNL
jgi:ATP-binding cassette, subfamily B, bacterial PglK